MASIISIDQCGRTITLNYPPQRIISVVPSQTELLFDLGLEAKIDGVTWFCVHPKEKCKAKTQIGGTKNLKTDKIKGMHPDLIIANKEENEQEQIEELARHIPTWISDIKNLDDSLSMIKSLGEITGTQLKANEIAEQIAFAFSALPQAPPLKVLYLIWRKPWMSIGSDTFIHDMLTRIGLVNVCAGAERYPKLTIEQINELKPEMILLSSEPYPFKEQDVNSLNELLPLSKILLADGEMFSWYGSRLLKAAEYLREFVLELG